ncbi:hypothetical protein JTB14_016440 [Gonioctena quinquepunctata]|nr:hypothetical protein JTB14_016440 [Gonioctena quinquepunctata]
MKFFLVVVGIVVFKVANANGVNKCCRSGEVLKRVGESFECTEDLTKRVQVRANITNFLYQNASGQCVETLDSAVVVLGVSEEGIVSQETAEGGFFPKCCPLNFVYNTFLHSCVATANSAPDFFQEPFVKVGLTSCKLVSDTVLNGTNNFRYKFLNSTGRFENDALHPGSYCIDKTEKGSFVVRECRGDLEVCEVIMCIKKCCPDGQSFVNGPHCTDTYEYGLNLSVLENVENPNDPFAIIYNSTYSPKYKLGAQDNNFTLHRNGLFTLFSSKGNTTVDIDNQYSYCIEYYERGKRGEYSFFHAFPAKQTTKFDYTFWPMVLSSFFLALTIFIYVVLNETKKMFGKILVNYCVATFFSFSVLAYALVKENPTHTECEIKAFSIIFFAVASFTWSNIMCCDIWCTFGTTKRYLGTKQKKKDLTKLLLYSFYGWGVPLLLTLLIYVFHKWHVLPHSIQPYLAEVKCFFDNKEGNFAKDLFYNIPLLIIQMVNMVLFIKTVIYCVEVKNEINRINDTTKDDKMKRYLGDRDRLFLILKLLVIMGMSFIFEVVSAFFQMSEMGPVPEYIELVWDMINALQGVFIFFIFIPKKKLFAARRTELKSNFISFQVFSSSLFSSAKRKFSSASYRSSKS